MKRMLLAAGASATLALAAPGVAGAHKAHKSACRHHRSHHACALRHAHRSKVLKFGSQAAVNAPGATTTTPASPSSPVAPAGKVASFTEGVLTIELTDKSLVSGKVTESTELRCSSAASAGAGSDDDESGDDSGGDGSSHVTSSRGDDLSGGHGDDDGAGDDEDGSAAGACTTAALVAGATVGEAELKIGPSGATWEKVELVS
jgi:hypothetical protein